MKWIRVRWTHDHPDEPIWLLSELDSKRMEVRKIEVFRNGSKSYADSTIEMVGTRLGEGPVPNLSDIAEGPQFQVEEISHEEFESAWGRRAIPDEPE